MPEVDLRDAIAMLKAGNQTGAQDILRQIVGMPAGAPAAPAAPMPQRDAVTPGSLLRKQMPAAGRPGMAPGMANQGMRPGMRPFAKGGAVSSASKRADGIAAKGKTKGKMVKMMGGGKC